MFTPDQIQFLIKNVRGIFFDELTARFNHRFKTNYTLDQVRAGCIYRGIRNNMPGGGQRFGVPKSVGNEMRRGNKGYIFVKLSDKGRTRIGGSKIIGTWKYKHHHIWEQAYGKIPKNHVVIFADRNRQNFSIDNLLLLSKPELLVMNNQGLITDNSELTKLGKSIAKLKLTITKRRKK